MLYAIERHTYKGGDYDGTVTLISDSDGEVYTWDDETLASEALVNGRLRHLGIWDAQRQPGVEDWFVSVHAPVEDGQVWPDRYRIVPYDPNDTGQKRLRQKASFCEHCRHYRSWFELEPVNKSRRTSKPSSPGGLFPPTERRR